MLARDLSRSVDILIESGKGWRQQHSAVQAGQAAADGPAEAFAIGLSRKD